MKLLNVTAFAAGLSMVAVANADVVGKWTGTMEFKSEGGASMKMGTGAPKMPKLTLEIKSDKTYKGTQTNNQDNKDHTSEGTWTLNGSTLTLTPKMRDGKPASGDGAKPRVYKLSSDGKTMTMDLTAQVKMSAKGQTQGKELPKFTAKMVLRKS